MDNRSAGQPLAGESRCMVRGVVGDTFEPGEPTPGGHEASRDFDARRFMVEAGILLASSLELDETLENITRLAVEHVADWCSVNLFETDGSIRRAAIAHRDPSKLSLARTLTEL